MLTVIMFVLFFLLIFMNLPVAFALGIAAVIVLLIDSGIASLALLPSIMYSSISSFTLLAIPFFVLAGVIMGYSGISSRLIDFAYLAFGHRKNGIVIVTIVAAFFFSAISGSGPATVAAMGTILIPALVKNGFKANSASALVASAGSLGIILPPSIAFIIFGVIASDIISISIGRLFIAGIIPGVLLAISLLIASMIVNKRNQKRHLDSGEAAVTIEKAPAIEVMKAFLKALLGLMIPIIILGGIYSGMFTPTEAAVVAVFYSLVVGFFFYRELKWKHIPKIVVDASVQSAVIMLIIGVASLFSYIITTQRVAATLTTSILEITTNPLLLLLLVAVILLLVGAFIDTISAFYIFIPLLMPVLLEVGVDPTTIGVMMTVGLAIGLFTPPVGLNLFVASSISGVSSESIVKGIGPYLVASIIVLVLVMYFPIFSNALPDLLGV
ncbi:TRAP transporter large permease [Shouchella lehensis]|uniref:C4-dicarboxylate transport system permease large protein n=1 Tax=Shouchella lehensis G1 TaxID=1246626 RepID=A0A060M322_9BACI|nr:TRAP transporter large permease [Shouchella lehensis]AIC94474.1 C4-dicarboxylate transport system permease large protein [Shouchella lehensis G1]